MTKWRCFDNPNSETVDVVLLSVPYTDTMVPLMAPAVLKPIVERAGLSCLAVDFNIEVQHELKRLPDKSDHVQFFIEGTFLHEETGMWLRDVFETAVAQILQWRPKIVGLSLLSFVSRSSAEWFCYYIKKMDPSVTVVLGGAGCLEQLAGPATFAEEMIANGLADVHIRGDGEQSFYEFLMGNVKYPGINDSSWRQLEQHELESIPYPDYSDYGFDLYTVKTLGLQGSKGCVRKCTFCDFIANWTQFRWRGAQNIFEEMVLQSEKYGIRLFQFHDTLVNGNLKEFNRLMELLSDYNRKNPEKSLTWEGFYIFRDKKSTDDHEWQLIKESGAGTLIVGIESINPDIRYAIGKKFTNESIDYHLEKALEHNIQLMLLFIVGYVTETDHHIETTKQWLRDHVRYQPVIRALNWGSGLGIHPKTYIHENMQSLGIEMIGPSPNLWINRAMNSTPARRANWTQELETLSKELGYKVMRTVDNHWLLEKGKSAELEI